MNGEPVSIENEVYAVVAGKPLTEMPGDLFIPPDALEVLLESFSGPLDLLLYLIRKQNIDILDIPMTLITKQYLLYISLMKERSMALAADYLVMAAMLAEIKSRILLPVKEDETEEEPEEDPRMVLIRRLQAYEKFKKAAQLLDELPRCERDIYLVALTTEHISVKQSYPDVEINELLQMMQGLIKQQGHLEHHQISREPLSVRERMSKILEQLKPGQLTDFRALYSSDEGRQGVVVSFLAILELTRQSLLVITQTNNFAPIHIKAIDYE